MEKYALISAALSVLIVILLPVHSIFAARIGNVDWLNMLFGLPIGLALAYNIEIIKNKINRK